MNYPLIQYEEYDTTTGNVDASDLFTATVKNQTVVVANIGTGGNQVTGVPAGSAIEDGKVEVYYRTQTGWRIKASDAGGGAGILTAGTGLTGGGDMTGNVTVNAVGGSGITANADDLEITPEGVVSSMIGPGAVGTDKIADGAVTSPKIGAGAVGTGKIADGAVTAVKLAENYATLADVFPVGSCYTQYPNGQTPASLGYPGTWTAQFETEGIAFRTPGGQALGFNGGIQQDAMQRITGSYRNNGGENNAARFRIASSSGAVTQVTISGRAQSGYGNTHNCHHGIDFDNANSVSPNPAKTNDVETRMKNRTFRVWRRTA